MTPFKGDLFLRKIVELLKKYSSSLFSALREKSPANFPNRTKNFFQVKNFLKILADSTLICQAIF
jgi:hypothetical protein